MTTLKQYKDMGVSLDKYVATIEIRRPPHNFFDYALVQQLADTLETLDEMSECRSVLLVAEGKSFCAGANFGDGSRIQSDGSVEGQRNRVDSQHLYVEAIRLFRTRKPIVAAIQGPAIGGGLGLALMPDFRVAAPEARFSANFTRLGFHPGFGLTTTLPRIVGQQAAARMFYTGERIKGEEAYRMGLADMLVPLEKLRAAAFDFARDLAISAPLAVQSTRATMRQGLAEAVKAATDHELVEQTWLRKTEDFKEGVRAMSERREPNFSGS
ncbi:MAG: enoyl-CoA hydratase/isomerase family protein [Hyphomicrobiaceae bacterium]|nr:enoyl-CoA hydratase/isomerase family protein [Hyphomicrobiaceae bacterium]